MSYSKDALMGACVSVLGQSTSPLRTREVYAQAWALVGMDPDTLGVAPGSGRPRAKDWLNNALHALKKEGKIVSVGRGLFTLANGEVATDKVAKVATDKVAKVATDKVATAKKKVAKVATAKRAASSLGKFTIPTIKDPVPWLGDAYLTAVAIASQSCFEGWDPSKKVCKTCPLRAVCAEAQARKVEEMMKAAPVAPVEDHTGESLAEAGDPDEIKIKALHQTLPLRKDLVSISVSQPSKCPLTFVTLKEGDFGLYDKSTGLIYSPTIQDLGLDVCAMRGVV